MRSGRRLDLAEARRVALRRGLNLLIHTREQRQPELYLGLVIDRSSSMTGDRIELARAFGVLLAESAKGLPNIRGHINAFDQHTFYRLGDFRRNAIASLQADGGNNDAAALARAAELALQSGRRHLLLIMISDGSPSACSFASLKALVARLTQDHNVVCAQAAVAPLPAAAFPHHVDVSSLTFDAAVIRFGQLLMRLTAAWH